MHALQELGVRLVALPEDCLEKIDLPEALRNAVLDARRMTKHEARRRQLQYVGRLMREVDPTPIAEAVDACNGVSAAHNARLHQLERLRERLLADEQVAAEIASTYPGADVQRLRLLRRNVLKEHALGKPPKSFRELFRTLRALADGGTA